MIGWALCTLGLHAWTPWAPAQGHAQRRVCTRQRCRGRTVQHRLAP